MNHMCEFTATLRSRNEVKTSNSTSTRLILHVSIESLVNLIRQMSTSKKIVLKWSVTQWFTYSSTK